MTFYFQLLIVSILHLTGENTRLEAKAFHMLFSSIRQEVPLSDGISRLAMPAVKGRGVRDALIETSTTWEFKCGLRCNLNTVRHCYNGSAKIVASYAVDSAQ